MVRVCLIYLGQKYKTLNVLNELGLSWKSAENNILLEIRLVEPVLRSIEPGRKSLILLQPLDSNFTLTHTLWASLNKTNTCFDHGLPTLHIRVLNTIVSKSLEPNSYNNNKEFGTSRSSYHSLSFSFGALRVYRYLNSLGQIALSNSMYI